MQTALSREEVVGEVVEVGDGDVTIIPADGAIDDSGDDVVGVVVGTAGAYWQGIDGRAHILLELHIASGLQHLDDEQPHESVTRQLSALR
jgi:hypothetical protein